MIYQYSTKRFSTLVLATLTLALLLIGGCGPVNVKQLEEQKNAKLLPAAEVLKLAEGNTLFFHSFHEDSYYYFASAGSLFGQDIYNNKDTGKWDVSDTGELCMKLGKWWYGDLRCFPVYGDGQKYYLVSESGVLAFRADLLPGDAKNQYRDLKKSAGKKSYRRAVRSQQQATAPAAAPAETSPEQTQEESAAETPPAPEVPPASPGELKATVKWMAKDCPGCNLAGHNLKKADLVGAKLQGANLAGANLSMANLRRADLQGANLAGADLTYANLPGADLRGCNLKNTDFKGANLIRANLTGAQVDGANFNEALLEGVQGLSR